MATHFIQLPCGFRWTSISRVVKTEAAKKKNIGGWVGGGMDIDIPLQPA